MSSPYVGPELRWSDSGTLPDMHLAEGLTLASIVLSVAVIVLLVVVLHRLTGNAAGTDADTEQQVQEPPARFARIAVVMNPSKHEDPDVFRELLQAMTERIGEHPLTFYDTTIDDPGTGQARAALADGSDLVLAAGGDGTVRMVAAAMAHSDVPMGILPVGTGNLMARNLALPIDHLEEALRIAVVGQDTPTDMGWLRVGRSTVQIESAAPQPFLVIAGVGADAEIMEATDPTMKKRIGWPAYVIPGLSRVIGHAFDARVEMFPGRTHDVQARTVLIGNVGKLPAGIVLMPEATAFNERLEVLAASWRGAAGLSQIGAQLVNPRLHPSPRLATTQHGLVKQVRVTTQKPQPVQLDGDSLGEQTHVVAEVDPGALRMRLPAQD
jgi:diacylglycerol kinase (ATP)